MNAARPLHTHRQENKSSVVKSDCPYSLIAGKHETGPRANAMTFKRRIVAGRSSLSVTMASRSPFENESTDGKNLLSSATGAPFGSDPAEGVGGDAAPLHRGGRAASRKGEGKKRLIAYTRSFWFRAACIAGMYRRWYW